MTCSTSDVAVCCSSDSVSSRVRCCSASNSRTFSIAMTAWSAKVGNQIDLLLARTVAPRHGGPAMAPSARPSRMSGTERMRTVAVCNRKFLPEVGNSSLSVLQVGDLDRLQIADRAASHRAAVQRHRFCARQSPELAERRGKPEHVVIGRSRYRQTCLANTGRVLGLPSSSTGCTSLGELEMTRRMSPIAVCCSSASSRSRVSSAIFLSLSPTDDGRLRMTFGALRRFSVAALRRRVLTGSPPGLERLLTASP